MRPFGSKRDPKTYQPGSPHPFQPIDDAGISALSSGVSGRFGNVQQQVATTNRFQRTIGCAVPGCGRAAADPIHAPAES